MDCIATLPGKSRCRRFLGLALFLSCLAVPFGFSAGSITPDTTAAEPPQNKSLLFTRPFSHVAIGVNFGTLGAGIEAVTPLSRKTNLRVDSSFFDYSLGLAQSGIQYNGSLNLRDTRASYDFFPWGKGFRISGGVAFYNKFNVGANATVPAGNKVTLNDVDYYSSPSDPLHGNASIAYGRKVAPTLTMGWGNAIPRSGRHLAFPFEIGAAFTGTPAFNLNFAGTGCTTSTPTPATCGDVKTFDGFQSNLAAQRRKIVNDIAPLRVYPIINMGVTYRFF
jgi:hypothetical protein